MVFIPKNQFIKNIIAPICQDCVYIKTPLLFGNKQCMKFGEKDLVTGKIKYSSVELCRKNENMCGANGRYFENKNGEQYIVLQNMWNRQARYRNQQTP